MTKDDNLGSILGTDSDVKLFGSKPIVQDPRNVPKQPCSVNRPGCNSRLRECRRRILDAPAKKGVEDVLPAGIEGVISASALEPCGSCSVLEQGAFTEDGPPIPTGPQLPLPRYLRTGNPHVHLMEDGFGFMPAPIGTEPQIVMRYTWTTKNRMTIQVITYGATIISIKIPDLKGVVQDVLLGFDDMTGYLQPDNPYLGATIGRVASYISNANYKYLHSEYDLRPNCGVDHYNGGRKGFDKWIWTATHEGTKIIMNHVSRAGTEGYPGRLLTSVTFDVTSNNRFIVHMQTTTDEATPVSLSQSLRFNLAGHNAGLFELFKHRVTIDADKYVEKDIDDLPTGKLLKVRGTMMDLRVARNVGGLLLKGPNSGYDHNMCITHKPKEDSIIFNSRILHPDTGRVMEIYSNQPGFNFNTCNDLPAHGYELEPIDDDEEDNVYTKPIETYDEDCQVTEDDIDAEMFPSEDEEEGEEEEVEEESEGEDEFGTLKLTKSQQEEEMKAKDSRLSRGSAFRGGKTSITLLSSKARAASLKPASMTDEELEEENLKMIAHRNTSDPDAGGAEWWGKTPPGMEGFYETAKEARMRALMGRASQHGPACSDDCPCRLTEEERYKLCARKAQEEEDARLREEQERLAREQEEIDAELRRLRELEDEEARRLAALLAEEEEEEEGEGDESEGELEGEEGDEGLEEGFKGLRYEKGAHKKSLEEVDSTLRDAVCKACRQPEPDEEQLEISDVEEEEEIRDVFEKLGPPAYYISGKGGAKYYQNCALGIQTQKYPDALHKKNFPPIILQPGEIYNHRTEYRFGIRLRLPVAKAKLDAFTETPDSGVEDNVEQVTGEEEEKECKDICDKIIILT